MAVYFIADIECPDGVNDAYARYIEQVRPIVEAHGGEYLARSGEVEPLFSDWRPDRLILIRFESREALDRCFASPEYRAIMALRAENVRAKAIIVPGI